MEKAGLPPGLIRQSDPPLPGGKPVQECTRVVFWTPTLYARPPPSQVVPPPSPAERRGADRGSTRTGMESTNARSTLLDDGERTERAIRQANGKRLMYKEPA